MKDILLRNLNYASGGRGLDLRQLNKIFSYLSEKEVAGLVQCLSIAYKQHGLDWLNPHISIETEFVEKWYTWKQIDEPYNEDWGFPRNSTGCYLYGIFKDQQVPKEVDFLSENVIYIGQSSSMTRDGMYQRRADFKSNIKNDLIRDYSGNSVLFKNIFGKDHLQYVYQAYLPLHQKDCERKEMEIFCRYYDKHKRLPVLNYVTDLKRVEKAYSSYRMWNDESL